LGDMSRLDFNYSIATYPQKVIDMIGHALPWTIGLLLTTTIFSWIVGGLLGAFMGWPRSPKFLSYLMPPLLSLNAIPFFLLGLLLIYFVAFRLRLLPLSGGYTPGTFPALAPSFMRDVLSHSILPALSIILVSVGGWALTMRAMMITTQGEDYVTYADAKGLKGRTIFTRYAIRNALLPQTTALALALGQLISGALLVEVVFTYPGIGTLLYRAIRGSDFYVVQGIVFILIVSIGLATFILDLIYPVLDPRITYRRA
jgi:peptide/nickel transport system permease protein